MQIFFLWFILIHVVTCESQDIVCQQLSIAVFMLIRSNNHVTWSKLMWRTEVFWDEMLCHWVNIVLHLQGLSGPSRNEHNWTFILFILCIVSWCINFISTNKCTILYIMYFSINLLLYVWCSCHPRGVYANLVKMYDSKLVLH